jgi:small-conductance mechanosensitive channel
VACALLARLSLLAVGILTLASKASMPQSTLAIPFFTVYMIKELHVWGRMADRVLIRRRLLKRDGLLVLFFLFSAITVSAQKKKHHIEVPKTRVEYSLDTVVQRLDDMHKTLNSIEQFQTKNFDTVRVRKQLGEFVKSLAVIQDGMYGGQLPEYKRLLLYEYMLNYISDHLAEWRADLFQYNNSLVRMNAETEALAHDSVLRTMVTDSLYRQMYLTELSVLTVKWDTVKKKTATNLKNINALQAAITPPYFLATDLLDEVNRAKTTIAGQLFKKEYPYIWEDGSAGMEEQAGRSLRTERSLMQFFLSLNWGYYFYALVIGLLFGFWVWNNFRRLRLRPDGSTLLSQADLSYLHPVPIMSSLAVMLNVLPFFNLDAPSVFTQLGQFILMMVVSVLFWMRWPRKYFLYWGLVLLLYLCYMVTGPVLVPAELARLWLLGLNAASVVVTYYCIKRIGKLFPYPRIVRFVWWVCLALSGLSVLCNVFGRLGLAKIFSTSSIFGLVQIIVLSVFIDCILEGFTLQLLVNRSSEKGKHFVTLLERMQKGVERVLLVIALLAWLVAFAINLNVYDVVYMAASRVWNHVVHLGSISFRVGNVLLFVFILYLSNVVQKYIGYLYGVSDSSSSAQTSKKGSQLVMIRLILIIAGFLLAIAASGLPVDRITIVLGALGVGIGLGLQNIVNNLVSGIILIFERPFQLGDYIELNGKKGMVRDIGIRSSKMVTEAGTEIIMPNGDLLAGEVINWTVQNRQVRIEIPVTVEAGPSFESLTHLVEEALAGHADLAGEEKPRVLLNTSTDKTISFTVLIWVENISQLQTIKSEVLDLLYRKLKENGVKMV